MQNISLDQIEKSVQGLHIPPKPDVLNDIHTETAKEDPNINTIAEAISRDVGLSANILKMINSPAFGLSRTISDIKQSVMLLGLQNVINLVTYYELRRVTTGKSSISLERFWDTAADIAQIVTPVLDRLNLKDRTMVEDGYALGLFHDCGIAMMALKFPDYKEALQEANAAPQGFTDIEDKHYSTNHAIVGYYVANSWNLPDHLCELVLRHHEDDFFKDADVSNTSRDLLGVLRLATNIQHNFSRLNDYNEWDHCKAEVLDHFKLSEEEYKEIEVDIINDLNAAL